MIKFFKRNSNWIYITVLILLSCYLFLFNLGGSSLNPWDEGIYTLISNQVIEKGGLSLYLNDTLWYEKPPLGFWIQALSIKLFGLNEIAVRIPSSLYLVITSFVLYLFCRELFKNKHLAFLTSFLIITSPLLLHQHFSRSGDLDSGFLLLAVTAFYFLLRSKQNAKFLAEFVLKTAFSKINVIPLNEVSGKSFQKVKKNNLQTFKEEVLKRGVDITQRKTRGDDINAACGQLVVNETL